MKYVEWKGWYMKLTIIKIAFLIITSVFALSILMVLYGMVNSLFCSYNLKIAHSERNQIHLTCRAGKISVLHTTISEHDNTVSRWIISARQLLIGNQLIFIVWQRERIGSALTIDDFEMDDYNYTVNNFSTLFYFIKQDGNRLTIFEKFPDVNVYTGEIKGNIGLISPK